MAAADQELLVIIDNEDGIVRVFENTAAARKALDEWIKLDRAYCNDEIEESEYHYLSEHMKEKGVRIYTTYSRWDVL